MRDEAVGRWVPGPPSDELKTGEQVLVAFTVHQPLHLLHWVEGAWLDEEGDAIREKAIRFHARVSLPPRSDVSSGSGGPGERKSTVIVDEEHIRDMTAQVSSLAEALEELLARFPCECGDRQNGHLAHCPCFDAVEALREAGRIP